MIAICQHHSPGFPNAQSGSRPRQGTRSFDSVTINSNLAHPPQYCGDFCVTERHPSSDFSHTIFKYWSIFTIRVKALLCLRRIGIDFTNPSLETGLRLIEEE